MKLPECKNLSLYWEKYSFLLFEGSDSKDKKKEIVREIFRTVEKLQSDFGKISNILRERREQLIKKRKPFINLKMKVRGKLLLGAGNPSLIEVGITLSRNYGLPIIPGTAIKGTFASFLFDRDEYESLAHIFGDTEREGSLIFLDAIPVSDLKFSLDIVNPHFQPYYMKEKLPPNDWYNPVPKRYLVVSSGVFWFTVLETCSGVIEKSEKEQIKQRFVEMLRTYGMGAKTSYGYGRFKDLN